MNAATAEFWFTQALLLLIAALLGFKALLLRRESRLGLMLALGNAAFTVAYVGAFLTAWFPFFRSPWWLWPLRAVVLLTVCLCIREFYCIHGGWRGMAAQAWRGLWERVPDPDAEGY